MGRIPPSPSLPHKGGGDIGAPTFETEPPGKGSELRNAAMSPLTYPEPT